MKHVTSAVEDAFNGQPRLRSLTATEVKVMECMLQWYTAIEIATALGIAQGTVRTHLRVIRVKLQVSAKGRPALIAAYLATRKT